jgi:hypothetical protein
MTPAQTSRSVSKTVLRAPHLRSLGPRGVGRRPAPPAYEVCGRRKTRNSPRAPGTRRSPAARALLTPGQTTFQASFRSCDLRSGGRLGQTTVQMNPRLLIRITARQMHPHPTTTLHHPRRYLQQAKPKRAPLCRGITRPRSRFLQPRHQHTRRRVQQQSHLIRHKPVTTRPSTGQVQFDFFDPVLTVAPLTIE